jgi:hypothetical protein
MEIHNIPTGNWPVPEDIVRDSFRNVGKSFHIDTDWSVPDDEGRGKGKCKGSFPCDFTFILTENHGMKVYWGSGSTDPCIPDLGTRWRWMVTFTPRQLYPQGNSPWYPLDRRQRLSPKFGNLLHTDTVCSRRESLKSYILNQVEQTSFGWGFILILPQIWFKFWVGHFVIL